MIMQIDSNGKSGKHNLTFVDMVKTIDIIFVHSNQVNVLELHLCAFKKGLKVPLKYYIFTKSFLQ